MKKIWWIQHHNADVLKLDIINFERILSENVMCLTLFYTLLVGR